MKLGIKTASTDNGLMSAPSQTRDVYYPEFTVTQQSDPENDTEPDVDLDDAPEEGIMTIRYCISRSAEDNKTGRCTYTIEVKELIDAKNLPGSSAPTKSYNEAGDALDKLAAEKAAEKDSEGY